MVNPLLGMSSLSFSSILKNEEKVAQSEDDAFKTDADSAQPEGKLFDDAQLGLEWRGMCNRMTKKYVALSQRMKNIDPVITDYPNVEIVAENQILYDQMLTIKSRIRATLAKCLKNGSLQVSIRLAKQEEIKPLLSPKETLDQLVKENTAVGRLVQSLSLDLA